MGTLHRQKFNHPPPWGTSVGDEKVYPRGRVYDGKPCACVGGSCRPRPERVEIPNRRCPPRSL
jgi:hypothetical protein